MSASALPALSGALVIDKPEGLTSQQCVSRIKHTLINEGLAEKGFKIGHGGTLDPFATGVLIVLIGEATKLADCYLHSHKAYSGIIALGTSTSTGDLTGETKESAEIPPIDEKMWNMLASEFINGPYEQVPPMYSAKKVDGEALYELARRGEEIERKPILKKIESFKVKYASTTELSFEVACESGTYVRVLAEDLAIKAGTRAHLKTLRRTRSSDATINCSMGLEQTGSWITNEKDFTKLPNYVPLARVATHISSIRFQPNECESVRRGVNRVIEEITAVLSKEHGGRDYLIARDIKGTPVALFENRERKGFRLQRVFN